MDELTLAVRAAQAAVDEMDEAAAHALGINRTDQRCLDIIDREGPLTAGALAERSGLPTAAVTTVLDRLERAGYALRVRDPGDRRRVLVEMTPLMHERATAIWGPIADWRSELRKYTAKELELLRDFHHRGSELNKRRAAEVRELRFDTPEG